MVLDAGGNVIILPAHKMLVHKAHTQKPIINVQGYVPAEKHENILSETSWPRALIFGN